MSLQDIKLMFINFATLGISMSSIEMSLKIILLLVTIGYTLHKWISKNNDGGNK